MTSVWNDEDWRQGWRVAPGAPGIWPPNLDEPVPLTLVGPAAVPFGSLRAAERPGPGIMFIDLDQP
jgi:hypothetical protein